MATVIYICVGLVLHVFFQEAVVATEVSSELSKSKIGCNVPKSSTCGGFIEGPAGIISYKYKQTLLSTGEGCIWTVIVPRKSTIQVKVIDDGFQRYLSQRITLLNMNSAGNELEKADQISVHPDRSPHNITGSSLIQIVFTSYGASNATGFYLTFEGIGPDINSTTDRQPNYIVYETNGASKGVVTYKAVAPFSGYDFVLFTLNPQARATVTLEYIRDQYRGQSYRLGCGQAAYQKFIVSDFDLPLGTPSQRLRECYPYRSVYNTTVISAVPLQVAFSSAKVYQGSIQFSWELV